MNNREKDLINNFINGKYLMIDLTTESYNYDIYKSAIDDLKDLDINILHYEDVMDIISKSKYNDEFLKSISSIKTDLLYKSYGHGLNHNIRVALFSLILCINEDVPLDDFRIIIDGAKYHDIGRTNDLTDDDHGLRSSLMLDFLKDKYSKDEMNYLKTIVQCHSLDDDLFDSIAKENGINDIARCRRMLNILKDADALDRARLEESLIMIPLMRTTTSKKLIPFAYEMYEGYDLNYNECEAQS